MPPAGRRRGRSSGRLALALVVVTGGACALLDRGAPADLVLERRSPPVLPAVARADFALVNRSGGPLVVPRPSDAFLLVSGETGEGRILHCLTPPKPRQDDVAFVTLAPGAELAVPVDLAARCDRGRQEDLRYAVRFAVPEAVRTLPGGGSSWVGTTGPARVQIAPAARRPSQPAQPTAHAATAGAALER